MISADSGCSTGTRQIIQDIRIKLGLRESHLLVETAGERAGSYARLAKQLEISKKTLADYRDGKSTIPDRVYRQLTVIASIFFVPAQTLPPNWGQVKGGKHSPHAHLKEIEHQRRAGRRSAELRQIKNFEKIKRRLSEILSDEELSADFAEFIGRMLGDGSLTMPPTYKANELESQIQMVKLAEKLFRYQPLLGWNSRTSHLRRPAGYALQLLGIPLGRKTINNPHFPEFIVKAHSKNILIRAIRGFFDDESYVATKRIKVTSVVRLEREEWRIIKRRIYMKGERYIAKRRILRVMPDCKPPRSNLLDDISTMLEALRITHSLNWEGLRVHRDGSSASADWDIYIYGRRRVMKAIRLELLSDWKSIRAQPT